MRRFVLGDEVVGAGEEQAAEGPNHENPARVNVNDPERHAEHHHEEEEQVDLEGVDGFLTDADRTSDEKHVDQKEEKRSERDRPNLVMHAVLGILLLPQRLLCLLLFRKLCLFLLVGLGLALVWVLAVKHDEAEDDKADRRDDVDSVEQPALFIELLLLLLRQLFRCQLVIVLVVG